MIQGVTFDNQQVSAAAHGALFNAHSTDGVLSGCSITHSGYSVNISEGFILMCGREVRISARESATFTQSSGYGRIRLRADMSGTASETEFSQVQIVVDYAASTSAFDAITQEDINNGGNIYDIVIGIFALSSSGVSSVVQTIGTSKAVASVADEAVKLKTARSLSIQDADGTNAGAAVSFDGSSAKVLKLPSSIKANLTGNVTGNVSGSSSSCTGNANTATRLETSRKIGNANFNGSSDISLEQIGAAAASHTHNASEVTGASTTLNAYTARRIYISNAAPSPSDGQIGDIWIVYS